MSTRLWAAAILAMALPYAPWLQAQDFPGKPVRIVVPFAPGGVSDILGRVLSEKLAVRWKQPVIVENRPGAGGALGAEIVAKSLPDGHTLLIADASVVTTNPFLYPTAPKDFAGVINLARFGQILIAPASSPLHSVADLIAMDKEKSARLNVASSGNGTSNHLVLEKFKVASKTGMSHVPYKGAGQAVADVAGGQVDLMFTSAPLAQPLIASGKIKALAVTSAKRIPGFAQVPTLAETGFAGFEWYSVQGMFAPPGTPAALLEKINADVAMVIQQPEIRERWEKLGLEEVENTPEEFSSWIATEAAATKMLIQSANIKVD
jgi:tripartite-type tricarboxylate transporter receptor subunit TctC